MNIVYVSREYGPITGGGIGTYVYHVCKTMAQQGHRVILVSDCVNAENADQLDADIEWRTTVPTPEELVGGFFSANHEYAERVYYTLLQLTEEIPVDVVEFPEYCGEGFTTIRAKKLLNQFKDTRLIVKCHTPLSLLEKINEEFQFHASVSCDIEMEDYSVRYADKVTSPSLSLADYFKNRVGRSDIAQCPYPLSLDYLDVEKPWETENIKTIRFLGSVQVRKGVDVFIEAAKKVLEVDDTYRFEIYGKERNAYILNRTYTEVLEKQIPEEWKDKIVFKGGIEYSEVGALLENTTVCVLPSRWENWANACLESMAKGCVVFASDQGGMGEIIEDGVNGYTIDPKDVEALANRLLGITGDISEMQRISQAAIERARELTEPESVIQRIMQNYEAPQNTRHWVADEKPLVSVVVPYFNQPDTLKETLESIRLSSYPNIETIVINDGSTSENANETFDALEGVTKIEKPNGGLSSARNAGITAATGDFVLPLDSDDKIHPNYIKIAIDALRNNPDLGYVSCYTRNFGAFYSPYIPVGYVPNLMPFLNTQGKCTNLYRKSVLERVGGYDESMNSYEDWDLLLGLHEKFIKGDVLPMELFYYRRNYGSMVFTVANPQRASLIQYMLQKHQSAWQSHAATMVKVMSRLWKESEMKVEELMQERFQIFWAVDDAFSEQNSIIQAYSMGAMNQLEFKLTGKGEINSLRLDPCDDYKTFHIREIAVIDMHTNTELIAANMDNDFAGIEIAGTAERVGITDSNLHILSTGQDPQIIIHSSDFVDKELKVLISFQSF